MKSPWKMVRKLIENLSMKRSQKKARIESLQSAPKNLNQNPSLNPKNQNQIWSLFRMTKKTINTMKKVTTKRIKVMNPAQIITKSTARTVVRYYIRWQHAIQQIAVVVQVSHRRESI